ncbi:MAG: hypothetical protein HOV94_34605 [Saccharothrix sp.]|nr:hypothetical protein [Saccharothrix sp.]
MSLVKRTAVCLNCHRTRPIYARNLCGSCTATTGRNRTRDRYPRTTRAAADVAEDTAHLTAAGESLEQIAARLGYRNVRSLQRALSRHEQRVGAADLGSGSGTAGDAS